MIIFESYELDDNVEIVSNESLEPEMLECAPSRGVIPDTCLTFSEQSLYVAEAAQEVYNEMFESIGIEELAVYEATGSIAVYEGARLDALKNKAIALFKKIWSTIKEAYDKIISWFEEKMREARKKKLVKFGSANIDKIPKDKKLGKTHKFNLEENFAKNAKVVYNKAVGAEWLKMDKDNVKDKCESLRKDLYSKISGTDGTNLNDMKEALKKKMLGEEVEITKEFMKSNTDIISKVVIAGNGKRAIKKAYNEERSHINGVIKNLKSIRDDKDTVLINAQISLMKDVTTILHGCLSVKMDVSKRQFVDYMNMVRLVASYDRKKATNESYDFSDPSSVVEAAFDW